ncbi:immunoglobulin-like domain-containing protein [Bifidobacterium callitrichidarum]|nr:immunoglobulin-like domain-containing protein [Bifidobacterium callitrichidarum]
MAADFNLFSFTLDTGKQVSIDAIPSEGCGSGCANSADFKYKGTKYVVVMEVYSLGSAGVAGYGRATVYFADTGKVAKELGSFTCNRAFGGDLSGWVACGGPSGKISLPTPPKQAILKFDANTGVNAPTDMIASGTSGSKTFKLSGAEPSKTHWSFLGWNTDQHATAAAVSKTGTISVPYGSTVTLYAIWQNYYPALKGVTNQTIPVGSSFDPKAGVTATDPEDGNVLPSLRITGTVDASKPGQYELIYTVQDAVGYKTTAKRMITVQQFLTSMPSTGVPNGLNAPWLLSIFLSVVGVAATAGKRIRS